MIYTPDTFIVIHLCILMCVNHVIKCYICQSVCLSIISITYIQLYYMCYILTSQRFCVEGHVCRLCKEILSFEDAVH